MKKHNLLCFFLFFLLTSLLYGCAPVPYAWQWHIYSYEKDILFANDVERQFTCIGLPAFEMPFASQYEDDVSISFFEDGTVQFEPQGQEMLSGTYTYRQVGQKYTEFTVTLNNGESFSGTCNSYYYDGDLEFTYREKRYHFTRNRNEDPDMYERYIQWFVVDPLRNMEKASEFTPGYRGTITKENGVYTLQMIDGLGREESKMILTLDDSVAVYCARVDSENRFIPLGSIEEGDCFCAPTMENGTVTMVSIYYLEPLAEQPTVPTEPDPTYLSDLRTWLRDFVADESDYIKMTHEFDSLPPGYKKHHKYITDQAEVQAIIDRLRQIEVVAVTKEEFAAATSDEVITIRIYSGSYELEIASHHGYFIRAEYDYYRLEDFPEFDYTNAVRSFIVSENSVAKLYDEDEHMGTYLDLDQYEFVVDTEEHDYTSAHYWTLVCEFGEIQIYDERHFRYKGQNYVIVGEWCFEFAKQPQ